MHFLGHPVSYKLRIVRKGRIIVLFSADGIIICYYTKHSTVFCLEMEKRNEYGITCIDSEDAKLFVT